MDSVLGLIIFFEILLTLGIVFGAMHETTLIRFEDRVMAKLRGAYARRKAQRQEKANRRFMEQATYTPVKPRGRADRSDSGAAA